MPGARQPRFQGSLLPVLKRENLGTRSSVHMSSYECTGEVWRTRENGVRVARGITKVNFSKRG